ncbi:uncharacterized protein N7443_004764 [Penicillium atrosanguineum]|uniref:uncharacterized protein n=1 Tax=Penicillium atrosanguineum TaxID=1132637 RepID=UPI00238A0389|nr:uncharacterized protein N7443_004764 [Penicillium atrosanguineum]KAJ5305104.1 hypothetical protein N7443_004764 [Penicillium atrosanguineum]
MPPSTVFSYWRRDHRRSTAPPASSPASKGSNDSPPALGPPQLPEIPDTPTITTPFDVNQSYDAPPWADSPLEIDASKLNFNTSVAPLSSSVSLAVPSPSPEKDNRPNSSPNESVPELGLASQPHSSQPSDSMLRPEQGDVESNSKPNSPFRLSFGGRPRALQTPTTEGQKRSPTAGPGSSYFGLKTSPGESPSEKPVMPHKESRIEGAITRWAGDREVPGDHAHHKPGKAMLHLLNPMSLLARRRSSQIGSSRVENPKIGAQSSIPAIPDDYDPRIRGNIVHDFSAPRPRRTLSGTPSGPTPSDDNSNMQDASPSQSGLSPATRWNNQTRRHSDHSPVFKEHFEDDQNVLQPEKKGYLQSSLLTNPTQHGYEKSIPVFARKLPSHLPEEQSPESAEPNVSPPAELLAELPAELPAEPPKATMPEDQQNQTDPDIIPNVPHPPSSIPRHLKSNSSRFSFDMGGVESSVQEKLLEERHKAKEATRKMEDGYFDDFDDDFDHDLMDDLDDLEEKIPGVNADADDDDDDDEFSTPYLNVKSWAAPKLSPVVASPITPAPPEIQANTTLTKYLDPEADSPTSSYSFEDDETQQGLAQAEQSDQLRPPFPDHTEILGAAPQVPDTHQRQIIHDEDDMYFDDGEFGDLSLDDQDGRFDETVFDDVTSHLYERKPVMPQEAQNPEADGPDDESLQHDIDDLEENATHSLKHMPSVASTYQTTSVKRGPLGEPIPNMGPARGHGGVLTEQNLDILHNALAFAANEAASKSRVERNFSTSDRSLGQESVQTAQTVDSQPGLVSDDSRLSQGPDIMTFEESYDDQILDDDAYWDDAIIAAANAEALENDDDGFYGQEFGFYAEAHDTASSELTNGGYFGPRGVESITRSHSSRGKFQEPSLTPITERSEWSTRNSMISLKAHGAAHSNPSLASPGLAQLVDMGNLDDEMSLSALMKLRRGAWGGSNGSLRSSAGSPPPHTLPSSNRASFTGASDASPSDVRPPADDGLAGIGYHQDDNNPYMASPLKDLADLPIHGIGGPNNTESDVDMPALTSQHVNVL